MHMDMDINVGRWPELISRQADLIRELGEAAMHAKEGLIQRTEFWAITDFLTMRIEEIQREMRLERAVVGRIIGGGAAPDDF
jgi:hypothetical protein